jgi:hypothetical protein
VAAAGRGWSSCIAEHCLSSHAGRGKGHSLDFKGGGKLCSSIAHELEPHNTRCSPEELNVHSNQGSHLNVVGPSADVGKTLVLHCCCCCYFCFYCRSEGGNANPHFSLHVVAAPKLSGHSVWKTPTGRRSIATSSIPQSVSPTTGKLGSINN